MAQYPRITPPGDLGVDQLPRGQRPVVADTVAAPIEQQVNGIEGMLYMSSQMGNDGSYTLTVTFDIGTDVNTALVMVQNRVALAMPQLPTPVQNQGITIRKKTPDMLMIVNFFSPDGRYDDIYLSNFATIYVKDELLRVYGVSDINYMGQRDYSIRAWLDPQKLASRNMTAMDVADAIRTQNLDAPAGQIGQSPAPMGQPFQLPVDTLGRLTDPEQFEAIVVKAGTEHRAGAVDRHRPPARRGPRRDGRPELQPVLHVRRPPVRGPLHLPAPRHQRTRRRRPGASQDGGAQDTLSRRGRLRHRLRHDAVSSASRSARSSRPCATPSSWSASSCWSSSRTGGP